MIIHIGLRLVQKMCARTAQPATIAALVTTFANFVQVLRGLSLGRAASNASPVCIQLVPEMSGAAPLGSSVRL